MSLQKTKISNLPPLPKKIKRKEAAVDGLVAAKLVKVHPHPNWVLEVKVDDNKLLKHQKVKLKQVENGTHPPQKIPDMGRQNPYDYYYIGDGDAIVCTVKGRSVVCDVNDGVLEHRFRI